MPKKIIIIISAVILSILLSFLILRQNSDVAEDIIISVADQPAMGLIFIAHEKGYFKENGLNVKYRRHILGRDALNDVLQKEADLATVFDSVVVKNIYEGKKLSIITSLHNSNRYHAAVSYKTSGIESARDLTGKKIGVTLGVSAEFFLNSLLDSNGINKSEATIVDLTPEGLIKSLQNNSVDAVVLFSPFLQQLELTEGSNSLNLFYSDTYTEESLLVAKSQYAEENRAKIIKILKALKMAQDYYENEPKEAYIIIDRWLKDYNYETITDVMDRIELSLGLSNTLLTHLERISEYYQLNYSQKEELIRIRGFILPDYLKKVDAEKVTIY